MRLCTEVTCFCHHPHIFCRSVCVFFPCRFICVFIQTNCVAPWSSLRSSKLFIFNSFDIMNHTKDAHFEHFQPWRHLWHLDKSGSWRKKLCEERKLILKEKFESSELLHCTCCWSSCEVEITLKKSISTSKYVKRESFSVGFRQSASWTVKHHEVQMQPQ